MVRQPDNSLFNGPIAADLPEQYLAGTIYEKMVSEGLLTITTFGHSDTLLSRATKVYETAFNGYRELETHPTHAPIVSYEQYIEGGRVDNVRAAEIYSEIEFGTTQLVKIVNPLIRSMQEIFGYYFNESLEIFSATAFDILEDMGLSPVEADKEDRSLSVGNMNQEMGLYVRPAAELDTEFHVPSFTPGDLDDLNEDFWGLFSTDFEQYFFRTADAEMGIDLSKKIKMTVFWKTIFDMYNVAQRCERRNGILICPEHISTLTQQQPALPSLNQRNLVRIYKLYLSQAIAVPRLDNIEDLLRLRDDKGLDPLRENLKAWRSVGVASDDQLIKEIRNEIDLAARNMKWARTDQRMGQIISYLGIPMPGWICSYLHWEPHWGS